MWRKNTQHVFPSVARLTMMLTLVGLCSALAVSWSGTARATIVVEMDLHGLVGRADQIVVGVVQRSSSRWTDDHRYIVTDTVIGVEQTIHGQRHEQVVVRRLGGSVNGLGMRVAGTVDLQPKSRVLLFIQRRGEHNYVVGMKQGAMRLEKNAKGEEIVMKDLGSMALARKSDSGLQLYQAHAVESPKRLDAFVREIQAAIALCKQTPSRCR